MFGGPRLTTVFASRWKALWWSAMVLTTAYCSVPKQGEENDAADIAAVAKLVAPDAQPTAAPPHRVNPWAKDAPKSAG